MTKPYEESQLFLHVDRNQRQPHMVGVRTFGVEGVTVRKIGTPTKPLCLRCVHAALSPPPAPSLHPAPTDQRPSPRAAVAPRRTPSRPRAPLTLSQTPHMSVGWGLIYDWIRSSGIVHRGEGGFGEKVERAQLYADAPACGLAGRRGNGRWSPIGILSVVFLCTSIEYIYI